MAVYTIPLTLSLTLQSRVSINDTAGQPRQTPCKFNRQVCVCVCEGCLVFIESMCMCVCVCVCVCVIVVGVSVCVCVCQVCVQQNHNARRKPDAGHVTKHILCGAKLSNYPLPGAGISRQETAPSRYLLSPDLIDFAASTFSL